MVVLFHFKTSAPLIGLPLIRAGAQFVDFFFVLSGFVIVSSYGAKLADGFPVSRFILLRFGRIYPLHLVMLAAFVIVECAAAIFADAGTVPRQIFDGNHSPAAILTNLTFLQVFGIEGHLTWNAPAWSIAAEFWVYLIFAVVAAIVPRRLPAILAILGIASALLLWRSVGSIDATYSFSVPRCLYGFAVGAVVWSAWSRFGGAARTIRSPAMWTVVELVASAAVVTFVVWADGRAVSLLEPPLFGLVVLVFARAGGIVSTVLTTPAPLFLGTISYSIYMVHSFVQSRMDDVARVIARLTGIPLTTETTSVTGRHLSLLGATPEQGTLFTVVMMFLVVGVAAVTWRLVEQPGQAWTRSLIEALRRRRRRQVGTPGLSSAT